MELPGSRGARADRPTISICRLRPLDAALSSGLCGKEGALPPVTGLTDQRIICCYASYWSCLHNLSSYWSGSQSLKIIVLSWFPTPVPVKLNDGKNSMTIETEITLFKRVKLGQENIQGRNEIFAIFCEL